jgi:hypothetical protein
MRRLLALPAAILLVATPLEADTIFQANAQGKQVVVQRDAIVVREDSSLLEYKHFELKDRRVTKVRLNKGSLPYSVETSSPDGQKQIVATWKRFGYSTSVTDQAGKTIRVFDAYLDFYPPGGRGSLLESVPPRTSFGLLLDGGGTDEIEFSKISRVELQGDRLKVTLRDETVEEGRFLMPTNQPAETRFLGITDNYNPSSDEVFDFSLPLAKLKEIRFE